MSAPVESPSRSWGPLARGCGCCLSILAGALALVLVATLALVSACRGRFGPSAEEAPAPLSAELPRFGDFQPRQSLHSADRPGRPGPGAQLAEARACILRGELTRARRLLLPLAPKDAEAALALAAVEDRLGEPEAARRWLQEAASRSRQARELLEFAE